MIKKFSEFKVPLAVTIVGLVLIAVLANPTDDNKGNELAQVLKKQSDSIAQLEIALEELSALSAESAQRTSSLESKIDSVYSRIENDATTINKAMGRISQRIAKQSNISKDFQQSIDEISTSSSTLSNHVHTLDSAAVQQHSRHIKLQNSLIDQQNELEKLLKLNAQLGDLFRSFGKVE